MNEPLALCNCLVILATGLVSFFGFTHRDVEEKYIFHPESILAGKQYYRLVTSAFLHANWSHLLWNMFSLYFFGNLVELFYGKADFLLIYFGAILGGSLLSLYVHRHHEYLAYGASGGVCGMIFAYILLFPGGAVRIFMIPIAVPGWLYAIAYIAGSFFALKAGRDNVGHDAHLGGAIVGLLIAAGLHPQMAAENWKIFLTVLLLSSALLAYLWINPMFLPLSAFSRPSWRPKLSWSRKPQRAAGPPHRVEQLRVDQILEKVAREGMGSLTEEEKALLQKTSAQYRRRADSKKPDSGLAI